MTRTASRISSFNASRISSFNGGEVSPELHGRTDINKYESSLKTALNFIIHPEGGAHRRSGTRFIKPEIDNSKKSRLIPFIFSTEQAYMLEFGDGRIRVFADEVQVQAAIQSTTVEAIAAIDEFFLEDHGYVDQQGPIQITASAGIPSPLVLNTVDYWIVAPKSLTFTDSDITLGSDTIDKTVGENYETEQGPFRLSTTGELPEPLSANLDYYIGTTTATTFKLRLTPGGADIVLTGPLLLGTHAIAPVGSYTLNTFKLSLTKGGAAIDLLTDGTGPHTFTPNKDATPPGLPQEILTPFTESELYELHFVQSADILFIDHPNHRPIQLSRFGNTKWVLAFQNILDGPYGDENVDTNFKIKVSATSGTNVTVTLDSPTGIRDGAGWVTSDIGRLVRIKESGNKAWGYVEITGIRETGTGINLIARGHVRGVLTNTGFNVAYRLGSWFPGNYPSAISFSDQRLWHAGATLETESLHASVTGDFINFAPTDLETDPVVLDTSGLSFKIGSNKVNSVLWLGVQSNLFAGTPESIFVARASLSGEAITPTNITLPQLTSVGAQSVQPVSIGQSLVYVTKNNQSLRAIQLPEQGNFFLPIDVTVLAKHIFGRTEQITTMAYQQDRHQLLWLTRSDGVLVCVTYVADQEVFAWHRHIVGGSFGSGNAVVESVAVIPSLDGSHDQLWMSVKRTIEGSTVRHIEILEDDWLDDDVNSMRFIDSAPAAYSGVAKSTFDGLDHLDGETIQVFAGGAAHPDRVVVNGSITLDAQYTDVVAGLGYVSDIETLELDLPNPFGSTTGLVAFISHVVLRFYKTLGGKLGPDPGNLDPMIFRTASDPMDSAPPVFTGDKKITFDGGYQRTKRIFIRQDQPLPLNLLAMNVLSNTSTR